MVQGKTTSGLCRCIPSVMAPTRALTDSDLDAALRFSEDLARRAGDLIKRGSSSILTANADIAQKATAVDLVTEWDVKVEQLIRSDIEKTWPDFRLYGPIFIPPIVTR